MRSRMERSLYPPLIRICFVGLSCILTVFFVRGFQDGENRAQEKNANMICYVCHVDLQTEKISTTHLDADITCQKCHGSTTEHMHDETLMTKPDVLWGRAEVNGMCSNQPCHAPGQGHEFYTRQDHDDPEAVAAFLREWYGKPRPNGRTIDSDSVCTDCHGKHNIDRMSGRKTTEEESADWISVFNGRDLEGWEPSGSASWTVENGKITCRPGAGPAPGALWSEISHEDFLLAVTFRAAWPVHAGIWVRSTGTDKGLRIEIFERPDPAAYTGSLLLPGIGLVLVNPSGDLVDRESWNTLSMKVEGDRFQVWLNGAEIGAVRTAAPKAGKIGFHIERPGKDGKGTFIIREVQIKPLEKDGASKSLSLLDFEGLTIRPILFSFGKIQGHEEIQ